MLMGNNITIYISIWWKYQKINSTSHKIYMEDLSEANMKWENYYRTTFGKDSHSEKYIIIHKP